MDWKSVIQTVVAISTLEAEYVVVVEVVSDDTASSPLDENC